MLPGAMGRFGEFRMAPAAERLKPSVGDAGRGDGFRELLLIEPRPSARGRKRSHVGEQRDLMAAQQLDENFDRMGGMADGEDFRRAR